MTQFKGTPGPWAANGLFVEHANGDVCLMSANYNTDISAANGRLIASAPALLAVAERWANAMWQSGVTPVENSHDPMEAMFFDTLSGIRQATGEDV